MVCCVGAVDDRAILPSAGLRDSYVTGDVFTCRADAGARVGSREGTVSCRTSSTGQKIGTANEAQQDGLCNFRVTTLGGRYTTPLNDVVRPWYIRSNPEVLQRDAAVAIRGKLLYKWLKGERRDGDDCAKGDERLSDMI